MFGHDDIDSPKAKFKFENDSYACFIKNKRVLCIADTRERGKIYIIFICGVVRI